MLHSVIPLMHPIPVSDFCELIMDLTQQRLPWGLLTILTSARPPFRPWSLFSFSLHVFHSIFHDILQKKKSNYTKKKRTLTTSSKKKSKKFTSPKSEKYASKKKKRYPATANAKLGVQVVRKKAIKISPRWDGRSLMSLSLNPIRPIPIWLTL